MDGAKDFVKRFTTVPEVFVDELFSMVDENTLQTQAVLDLDVVVTWLKVPKEKLLKTLRNSYVEDTDFTIINAPNPNKQKSKYGSNNYKRVMLTSACFKELGMRSNSKKSAMIRKYFIDVEDAFIKYRHQIQRGMEENINTLLANQKPRIPNARPGYVYMMRTGDDIGMNDLQKHIATVKIGSATQLQQRLDVYNTGRANNAEYLFQIQTDDMLGVEQCVKTLCKSKQYRKRKEVYQIDTNIMKKVIDHCAKASAEVTRIPGRKTQKGGFYAVLLPTPDSDIPIEIAGTTAAFPR